MKFVEVRVRDVFIAIFAVAISFAIVNKVFGETTPNIILDAKNHTVLLGEVDGLSVNHVIQDITNSDPNRPFFLILDSPGGKVLDGRKLVTYLLNTDRNIVCVAQLAASMAFITLEACPVRLITEHGILMSHQIAGGASGPLSDMKAALTFTQKLADLYDNLISKRLGLGLEAYRAKLNPEFWMVGGQDALDNKAVDAVVNVTCTKELEKSFVTYGEGKDAVKVSKCPIG